MWHYFKTSQSIEPKGAEGFTLIEMLVSIGIVVMILAILVSNQSTYTDTAKLRNAAEDMALNYRTAQTYGVGVREFNPGSIEFDVGYGIAISFSSGPSGSTDAYILFADRGTKNGLFDGNSFCPSLASAPTSECVEKFFPGADVRISDICYIRTNNTENCTASQEVDIVFNRPNTEASFIFLNSSRDPISIPNLRGARIELVSAVTGQTKSVIILTSGQISVQ